jgi:hypothetical protein
VEEKPLPLASAKVIEIVLKARENLELLEASPVAAD